MADSKLLNMIYKYGAHIAISAWRKKNPGKIIDLSGALLGGSDDGFDNAVNFSNLNLNGAIFARCRLDYCDFQGASLIRADFTGADLDYAHFLRANLEGAKLDYAIVKGTKFYRTRMLFVSNKYVDMDEARM